MALFTTMQTQCGKCGVAFWMGTTSRNRSCSAAATVPRFHKGDGPSACGRKCNRGNRYRCGCRPSHAGGPLQGRIVDGPGVGHVTPPVSSARSSSMARPKSTSLACPELETRTLFIFRSRCVRPCSKAYRRPSAMPTISRVAWTGSILVRILQTRGGSTLDKFHHQKVRSALGRPRRRWARCWMPQGAAQLALRA